MTATVRTRFLAAHAALEEDLQELANAADGARSDTLVEVWRRFESELLAHLEIEEERLFPLLDDEGTRAFLAADHQDFRDRVDSLGTMVELHAVRKDAIDELIAALRAHAAREDQALYALADAKLDEAAQTTLLAKAVEAVQGHLERLRKAVG